MVGPGKWCEARSAAVRRALNAGLAAAVLTAASGCGAGTEPSPESRARTALQRALDRQAAAVRDGSESGFLAAVDSREKDYRAAQRRVFGNLHRLPLTQWSYRVGDVRGDTGGGRLQADVRLRYKLRGDDQAPVSATERLAFTERRGKWYVSAELPGSERQLWEQGEVTVVHGENSLVLGADRDRGALQELARKADQAVSEVDRAWPRSWPHRVVVESPSSLRDMARLLDAPASSYEGIAAVTTGEAGEHTDAPADRIVVNPDAYGELSGEGRQVVLTHETVHVATRTHTSGATPLWLSEGFADWVGYGATDRKPEEAAAELVRAAQAGKLPRELPADRDFRFGREADELGRAYESGWLACRLIADEWGKEKLIGLYLRLGSAQKSQGTAVDEAMQSELGLDTAEFTEKWRSYVRKELS
ncbi:hypothetical protein [Streptomyces winkii]|uniref:hypothetical protein n=1 Tax=Streptomyces winkii TaxID=3051178 RepID=UPI0028D7A9C9|nr:hypothetical protein [Streptomyces sp. DSM 40971]